jgi:hypothetical protein
VGVLDDRDGGEFVHGGVQIGRRRWDRNGWGADASVVRGLGRGRRGQKASVCIVFEPAYT